ELPVSRIRFSVSGLPFPVVRYPLPVTRYPPKENASQYLAGVQETGNRKRKTENGKAGTGNG
ncbi:MAG TPA: hypothetical protein VGO75_08660, partial [Gemmatimonadaceae bacterium]|nr:hypothetical protein [Gemmatimonadaceae bacterium]